jgi:hypothetical protein
MATRRRPDLTLRKVRAAISNGSELLADLDHRCQWARRLRDLIADHTSDLGGAGAISQAEKLLIRRASMLALQLELQEQSFAKNEGGQAGAKQLETYQRCVNTLRRTLEALGLQRRARDVSPPTLEQYAQHLEAAE